LAHAVELERVLDVLLVGQVDRRALPLDVGAGAERLTLPGEDDRASVADAGESPRHIRDQRRVEGVAPLRPCERDAQHVAVSFHSEPAHRSELRRRLGDVAISSCGLCRTSETPLRVGSMLRGALAAALTPLTDAGEALDEAAVGPYVEFLVEGGVDGLLALGTAGEGVRPRVGQGRRAAQLFVEAAAGGLLVAVLCGAKSPWDTVELAAHAADSGADAVAVMAPPYFPLDEAELLVHLAAAARAADPTPFYVYEVAARSGHAVPLPVLEQLREEAPSFGGLKVSDTPWERFAPYLLEGLDIFVGPEALIPEGLAGGAVGAVSALAAAFPELVVAAVRDPASADLGPVRAAVGRFPLQAAAKLVGAARGVPICPHVPPPPRTLTHPARDA